ncbi:MAG: hypothetical protein ACRDN0_01670, partial [Trebonia sp.]
MSSIRVRGGVPLAVFAMLAVPILAGCAASPAVSHAGPAGRAGACTAYAYRAIERHFLAAIRPAACDGLTPEQVSMAAGTAIRE